MIEHHRRVIGKPGSYLKGQRLSISRAPVSGAILWNDELEEDEDFKIDPKQGVIIFLRDVEVKSWIGIEFDWDNPEEEGEETTGKRKGLWRKIFRRKGK